VPLFTREPFHVRMRDGRRLALKPPRGPRGLAQQHTPTRLRRASRTAVGVLLHQNWAGLHNQLRSLLSLAMLCTPCDTRFPAKTRSSSDLETPSGVRYGLPTFVSQPRSIPRTRSLVPCREPPARPSTACTALTFTASAQATCVREDRGTASGGCVRQCSAGCH
jgi:hypothetical protein